MDNCSGNVYTPESKESAMAINYQIRKLVANATNLIQPLDLFVISEIKDVWRESWENYNMELIMGVLFQDKPNLEVQYSLKLQNPGKELFLKLVAHSVRVFNQSRDIEGIYFS